MAVLERSPHDAERFLHTVHDLGGVTGVDTRPYGRDALPDGLAWLFGHALLVPLDWETAIVPREIALALRGGTPLRAYQLRPPALTVSGRLPSMTELSPVAVVDAIASIGLGLASEPMTSLRTGGVSVRGVRATAKRLGLDDRSTARLLDLTGLPDLLAIDLRQERIAPTPTFDEWLAQRPLTRWLVLVRAWAVLPSSLLRPGSGAAGRGAPLSMAFYADDNHVWRRGFVLRALRDGGPFDLATLSATARWHAPGLWTEVDPAESVQEILEEASLLGLLRDGALTALGRSALFGDNASIDDAAAGVFAAAVSTFTVQADLSALAPQELDAVVAATLARCAKVESRGAATVYRFTETSLRRAFDLGETASTLLTFLDDHAKPTVPQPLRYLIEDVARRFGNVRVGMAVSYVRSDDPALLAELLHSKQLSKLALRAIAPTVAISALPAAKVVASLRDAGFLPVEEDAAGAVAPRAPATSWTPPPSWRRHPRPQSAAIWSAIATACDRPGGASAVPLDGYSAKVQAAVLRLRTSEPQKWDNERAVGRVRY